MSCIPIAFFRAQYTEHKAQADFGQSVPCALCTVLSRVDIFENSA